MPVESIDITEIDRPKVQDYRDPTPFAFAGGPVECC